MSDSLHQALADDIESVRGRAVGDWVASLRERDLTAYLKLQPIVLDLRAALLFDLLCSVGYDPSVLGAGPLVERFMLLEWQAGLPRKEARTALRLLGEALLRHLDQDLCPEERRRIDSLVEPLRDCFASLEMLISP